MTVSTTTLPPGPYLLGRERHEVDHLLRREVLDHLDHDDSAQALGFERLEVLDRRTFADVETAPARGGDETRIGLDAAHLHTRVDEELHELTASEPDVEHGVAADQSLREPAVTRAEIVGPAAEARREAIFSVETLDHGPGNALTDIEELVLEVVEGLGVLRQALLDVVELLRERELPDRGQDVGEQ